MKAIVLKCPPHNQFRLGVNSLNNTLNFIHSDTLYSAILNTHAMMYGKGDTDTLNTTLKDSKHIKFSSAFHCLEYQAEEGTEYLFFLPVPITYVLADTTHIKTLKKIKFISKGIWEKGLSAKELLKMPILGKSHVLTWEELEKLRIIDKNKIDKSIPTQFSKANLVEEINYPKVHVRKEGQEAAYYTQTHLQLQQLYNLEGKPLSTHFYFLADGLDENRDFQLMGAIRMLVDEGIGGERSNGAGYFQALDEVDFILSNPTKVTHQCTLSLSIPENEQAFQSYEYYNLIVRGGGSMAGEESRSKTHYRRQIRMIQEGAMIKNDLQHPNGACLEIAKDKWRFGITMTIPFCYEV